MEKSKNSLQLYSDQILAIAGSIPLMDRLSFPDQTITKKSTLCGSMITIDLKIKNEIIIAYAHEVRSCVLGQASASILAKEIVGKSKSEIVAVRNSVLKMLTGKEYKENMFSDFHVLSPASAFKNRHDSIMLPLDATFEAITKSRTKK